MPRHVFLFAAVAVLLCGCIGLPLRAVKHLRDGHGAPGIVVTGDVQPPLGLTAELAAILRRGTRGVTAIVMQDGRLLYRIDGGDIGPDTAYDVASASKWLAAALVMTVVDDGRLALDEPIARRLPEFRGAAGTATLRQLLAQTSGQGSLADRVDIRQDPRMTLAQSAAEIARRAPEDPPGAVFRYGGPGFQVAGALVEAATGRRWAELFDARIARPLGMTHTLWKHLPERGATPAETLNPLLQGGAATTAADYMRFLTMLAQHGRFAGRQILSARAVEAMETAQTLGRPMADLPPGAVAGAQYALGNWCERWTDSGRCTLVSSPGAFGTFPWIDRTTGRYGIFFMRERLPRVVDHVIAARALILDAAR